LAPYGYRYIPRNESGGGSYWVVAPLHVDVGYWFLATSSRCSYRPGYRELG
jgi:hypothetical protein